MGMFDAFNSFNNTVLPNSSQYLTPDQQSGATSMGLMQAGLNLIKASSNHYGLPQSGLSIAASGLEGYGQGAQGYVNNIPTTSGAVLKNSQNDLALTRTQIQQNLADFYKNGQTPTMPPMGSGNSSITASAVPFGSTVTPPPQPRSTQDQLASFFGGSDSAPPTQIPPVNASALQPPNGAVGGGMPTPPPSGSPALMQPSSNAAPNASPLAQFYKDNNSGQQTGSDGTPLMATGLTVKQQAAQYYNAANYARVMGNDTAAVENMKLADGLDPAAGYSKAFQTAQGQLPAENEKIDRTAAQTRATEGYKASITPFTYTDAGGNTTVTNNATAAQGLQGQRALNPQQTALMSTDQKVLSDTQPEYEAAQNGLAAVAQIKQLANISSKSPLTAPGPLNTESTEALGIANDLIRRTGGTPVAASELASSNGINKLGTEMQAAATKILGSREAAQIFQQMGKTTPSSLLDPNTLALIANTAQQKFQRVSDRYNLLNKTMASPNAYTIDPNTKQYITGVSALNAYDQQNPGSQYATTANQAAGLGAGAGPPTGWSNIRKVNQ